MARAAAAGHQDGSCASLSLCTALLVPHAPSRSSCAPAAAKAAARHLVVSVWKFFARARCCPVAAPASAALAPFAPSLSQREAGAESSAAGSASSALVVRRVLLASLLAA